MLNLSCNDADNIIIINFNTSPLLLFFVLLSLLVICEDYERKKK